MKGQIRNIYPGGNTPRGFYSYYNYIMEQREAKKIFCLKGGPGTGKSTLMKNIGRYFSDKGENVDFFWCSSDPDSLDGILLRNRFVSIIDGTAPHIVDPVNPGAVDKIINLGEYWNEEGIRKNKKEILDCSREIKKCYKVAYNYLKCAYCEYEFIGDILDELIPDSTVKDIKLQLELNLRSISVMKRAECKVMREYALGTTSGRGHVKKFFAGAITPKGIKSTLNTLLTGINKILIIKAPVGFRTGELMQYASQRFTEVGFSIEEYYCPMNPEKKLEHIIVPEAGTAIITLNKYHNLETEKDDKKTEIIEINHDMTCNDEYTHMLEDLYINSESSINKAVLALKKAKEYHDILENYYIPNMNFDNIGRLQTEIINEIELTVKQ